MQTVERVFVTSDSQMFESFKRAYIHETHLKFKKLLKGFNLRKPKHPGDMGRFKNT